MIDKFGIIKKMAEESRQEGFLGRILLRRKEALIAKEKIGPFICVAVEKFHRNFIFFGLEGMPSLLDFSVEGEATVEIKPSKTGSRALSRLEGETVTIVGDEVLIKSGGAHSHGFVGIYGLDETGEGIVELKPGQKPGERAGFDIKPNEMVIAVPVYLADKKGLFVCGESRYRERKATLDKLFTDTNKKNLIVEINEARGRDELGNWKTFWPK